MQHAELKQIRGIGDTMCELLGRDHGIETIAELAHLSDTEVEEVERALRASRRNVRIGDVARWRTQARQLANEKQDVPGEPLATFVVEAWRPVTEPADGPHFVVHHIEADETLETSEPNRTIDDVVRWMQERVAVPAVLTGTKLPAEGEAVASSSTLDPLTSPSPGPPPRRGGLRITGLEVDHAGDRVVNGRRATSLLVDEPVAIEEGSALVFVGHVSLDGAERPVTCQMRCRLRRIESDQELAFGWSGEITAAPSMQSATISSAPVSIPAGIYRGIFAASDRHHSVRGAFRELPLIVVGSTN
jgi:ribosomal protein S13